MRKRTSAVLPVTRHLLFFDHPFQWLISKNSYWRASIECGWRETLAGLVLSFSCNLIVDEGNVSGQPGGVLFTGLDCVHVLVGACVLKYRAYRAVL